MELIRTKDAAKMFGVHPATLWRWAKSGKINSYKTVGGQYRYDIDELNNILKREENHD